MKKRKVTSVILSSILIFSLMGCSTSKSERNESTITDAPSAIQCEVPEVKLLSVDANASIVDLKADGLANPIGLDDTTPDFSWKMSSSAVGAAQSAYQIEVKDKSGKVFWDSGIVESQNSVDIPYEGEKLNPQMQYIWNVSVTDTAGNVVQSDTATFETGLMNESFDAWNEAKWIGASELPLDATSACTFQISAKVQIPKGSNTVSFILGADDFRLQNENFNINSMAGENYVRIELDVSNVSEVGGAKINAYRVGYAKSDLADKPLVVIENAEDLNGLITSANAHEEHKLELSVNASEIGIIIDGTQLQETLVVNDFGGDSGYNTYPNLNQVGFAAKAGETAIIKDYQIENGGYYGTGVLFGENVGSSYEIFKHIDGVLVKGNMITIDGGTLGILAYRDPSYGASPMLRKGFETEKKIQSARLYLTAQGIYNFYINGNEVAKEEWFNPGDSEYDQILGYNTYDVTEMISQGKNAMAAVLGEGWWTGQMTYEAANSNYYGDQPALMAMLQVQYDDGTSDIIVSDESWSCYTDGPVRLASFFQGESYDATKEVNGWNEAQFDDTSWNGASIVETRAPFSSPRLVTRTDTPVHVIKTTNAKEYLGATKEGTNSYIYDMGENVSGVPIITIPADYAKEGEQVTIRYAETLYPELDEYVKKGIAGTLMVENYRAALVTDFYTMKEGENVFAPDLTFHGYRYIEITGLDRELPIEFVKMQVLSSLDASAQYSSSNELANQLFTNITNSTTSNYISIPTDCPQRNERMGWTGDAQIFALTGAYIADTYNFMDQWMDTVRSDTAEDGMSTQYSPAFEKYSLEDEKIVHEGQSFGITWNALAVTVPYNLYMQTGRIEIVKENIDNIYAYVNTLISRPFKYKDKKGNKQEDIRLTNEVGTLADHLSRVDTSNVPIGNAVFIACLDEAAVMADAVGDADIAKEYRVKAYEAREAWNEIFIDSKTGKTRTADGKHEDTQASYATPLRFKVIKEHNIKKVLANYRKTIENASGKDVNEVSIVPYTLTTGFNATGNVLNALSDHGCNDTAYKLFESTEYASWLYPITQGATSIWERWNSYTKDNGFSDNNSMNSFNHYSFGAVGEWMMGYQAGITANDGRAGYQSFVLQPTPGGSFTSVSAEYDSAYGVIKSSWSTDDGGFSYDAIIPANTTATLYLPMDEKDATKATETAGVTGVTYVGDNIHNGINTRTYQLVAGSYHFSVKNGQVNVEIVN